ncbi:MAG: NTP transferase domain-containing protein, partial [Spirochaetales bacterium]
MIQPVDTKNDMETLLVINDTVPPLSSKEAPYRFQGKTALQRVIEYALHIVPKEAVVLLTHPSSDFEGESLRKILRPHWSIADLLQVLQEVSQNKGTLIFVYGDCPFLDLELTKKMLANHKKYFADYTFADGYPYGLTPEIFEASILLALQRLVKDPTEGIKRDTLFSLISKDINNFELETELSPEDLRPLRISLTTDTKRNRILCQRID